MHLATYLILRLLDLLLQMSMHKVVFSSVFIASRTLKCICDRGIRQEKHMTSLGDLMNTGILYRDHIYCYA